MLAPFFCAYCWATARKALGKPTISSGMLAVSILCRVNAPFQESTFGIHEELLRGSRKIDDSKAKSDSYIRPICGCWLSSAYKSEVPERHMPTTKSGAGLMGPAFNSALGSGSCTGLRSHFTSTAVLMLRLVPARTLS